jgi:prepilin-type N-terminal cleavage/methylation domain-containing protein
MITSPIGMRTAKNAGFTLIELVFVMALFVMLVSLSMPLFSRVMRSWTHRTCVEDILKLMELAHERAIVEHTDYGIHFDSEKKSYWLIRQDEGGIDKSFSRVPETWGRARSLPSDVDLRGNESVVFFHPNGTATSFSLDLISRSGHVFNLNVDPILGQGSVHEQLS